MNLVSTCPARQHHKHRPTRTCFGLLTMAKERNLKTVLSQFVNCFILLNTLQNGNSVVFREEDVAIVCFVCSAVWFVLKAGRLPVWVLFTPALAIRIEAKKKNKNLTLFSCGGIKRS